MTDTEVAPSPAPVPRPKFRQRRMWTPVAVAVALIVLTLVAALIESPSPGSDTFLSPRADSGDGSSQLAESLDDDGVSVKRYTDASEAFGAAASDEPTTVFIPAPDFLNRVELSDLKKVINDSGNRVVFVDPSRDLLNVLGLHKSGSARIAPKVVAPGGKCGLDAATRAGSAGMLRQAYAKTESKSGLITDIAWSFCYSSGLAWTRTGESSLAVAGASDPFTNEYFGEAGNAEVTTELLAQHDSVVWLDKHSLATPPSDPSTDNPSGSPSPTPESREPIDYPGAAPTDPVYDALPSWLWAGLIGVILLGLLVALWKGRRLGPPVTEPLPVTVPAAETVHGRARLYRHSRAYREALRALRAGAQHRIRPALGLSAQATDNEVVQAVALRTGLPAEQIVATLYETQPSHEHELIDASRAIDALVAAVENASPSGGRSNE